MRPKKSSSFFFSLFKKKALNAPRVGALKLLSSASWLVSVDPRQLPTRWYLPPLQSTSSFFRPSSFRKNPLKTAQQKTTSTNHSQNDDTTEQRKDYVHVFARLARNERSDFQHSDVFFLFFFFLAKFNSPAAHFPPNLSQSEWRQRRSIIAGAGGRPVAPEGRAGGQGDLETRRRF